MTRSVWTLTFVTLAEVHNALTLQWDDPAEPGSQEDGRGDFPGGADPPTLLVSLAVSDRVNP